MSSTGTCLLIALFSLFMFSACGQPDASNDGTDASSGAREARVDDRPLVSFAGTTEADVSTWQAFTKAMAEAFISGDERRMAAVAFPNKEMMTAHILQHYGAADAKAAIELLDTTMPMELQTVVAGLQAVRNAAIAAGADFSNAAFAEGIMVSGLRIGGMKVNTLGMDIRAGDRIYAFELASCRDILGRWVTTGQAKFKGVTGGSPIAPQADGSLDLGL